MTLAQTKDFIQESWFPFFEKKYEEKAKLRIEKNEYAIGFEVRVGEIALGVKFHDNDIKKWDIKKMDKIMVDFSKTLDEKIIGQYLKKL